MSEENEYELNAENVYNDSSESNDGAKEGPVEESLDQGQEGAEDAQSDDEGTEETKAEKPKSRFQKRIDKLHWEAQESKRIAAERTKELDDMREQHQRVLIQQQMAQIQQASMQRKPDPRQYGDNMPQFEQDYHNWLQGTQMQQQQLMQQQQAANAQRAQIAEHFNSVSQKITEAAAVSEHPDFLATVNDPKVIPLASVNPIAHQAMMDVDDFQGVAYYLAKNPAEILSFKGLNPLQVARKLAKIETTVATKKVLKGESQGQEQNTNAPPTEIRGRKGSAVKDPGKMSTSEYMKWRENQTF